MINEQTVKDIQAAIEVIKAKGWTKGAYQDDAGRVCLTGAIRVAISGNPYAWNFTADDWNRFVDVTCLVCEVVDRVSVVGFNDDRKTKKRHVLGALKAAKQEAMKGT